MHRDMTLTRAILVCLRDHDSSWLARPQLVVPVPTDNPDILDYHLNLCEQAGFIVVRRGTGQPPQMQLTWKGCGSFA